MNRIVKTSFLLFTWCLLFLNINRVNAAFDLENNIATYDSNRGLLTIYHSSFNSSYSESYTAHLSKFKLGNVVLQGTYQFGQGMLKVYVKNRDMVNQQEGFSRTNTIAKILFLEKGSIIKTYVPPGAINVVLDSPSNEMILDVNFLGLIPKMTIDRISTNLSTIENTGGNVTFTVYGDNLENASFKIKNVNSNQVYHLNVTKKTAMAIVNISPNESNTSRKDTYILYVNDLETDKIVHITVLEKKLTPDGDISNTNSNKPSNDINSNTNPNKPSNDINSNTNPTKPSDNVDSDNIVNPEENKNESISQNIPTKPPENNINSNNKKEEKFLKNHKNINQKNSIIFVILFAFIVFISSIIYYKFKILKAH